MALETTTQIFISGTPISSYKSIKLNQEISSHHDLTLVCRADVVETLSNELIGESKDHLGATISIRIAPALDAGSYREQEFKGIITSVQGAKGSQYGKSDMVIFHAKSTSILADDGAHYASFTDAGLAEILGDTFNEYDKGKLETRFAPTTSDPLPYTVQYNQSAFSFASRLAAFYNQWFYYDGSKLIFGRPSEEETELSYGTDLQNFSLQLSTVPNTFQYFTNDYLTDELHQKNSSEITLPTEGYHGITNQKSRDTFIKQTQVPYNSYTDQNTRSQLDTHVEQYTKAKGIKQVIATGESDHPGVHLGAVINVQGYGRYRITKITHTNTEGGIYKNVFEAISAEVTVYPKMDIHDFPKSDIQIAKVTDNNDPEGLGRVKAQFVWQRQSGQTTPWIRMMTPHAGADKGFHFIPEIDEEIIIGFENNCAEKPFVMGALYNGTAKPDSWQTDANNIKAIRSRSGHTVALNDTDGGEMITITDKNSNVIRIDTAANSIEISALENMTLNAKNIEINATEEIKINAGTNMVTRVSEDIAISAKNVTENLEENKTVLAKEILENAEKVRIESAKESMNLVSAKQVDIQGSENVKLF